MTNGTEDARLKKDFDVVGRREDTRRSQERQVTESREMSEDDRLEMFRNQLFNDALPELPELPGFHMCWLTTTNTRDPIFRRMQLGYEPVKPEEIPGMAHASIKTGEYAGMVGINEMIAFKLPMSLYQRFMQEAHHDAPLREEEKLAEVADSIRANAERAGGKVYEDDGMADLRDTPSRRGVFT